VCDAAADTTNDARNSGRFGSHISAAIPDAPVKTLIGAVEAAVNSPE
jgi:hypothetical protein